MSGVKYARHLNIFSLRPRLFINITVCHVTSLAHRKYRKKFLREPSLD